MEADALRAFEDALGLVAPPPLPDRPMFIARFAAMDRWSHEGALRATVGGDDATSMYPLRLIGEIGVVAYGIQKAPINRPGTHPRPYLSVANVQRSRLDLAVVKYINVTDAEMPRYRLMGGDLLLCEGNSSDQVGRGAIWRNQIHDCVHQNHILRIRFSDPTVIPEFVLTVINSGYGQSYFRSRAKKTTNLASINSKEVARFTLPMPPADVQLRLMSALNETTLAAATLRADAAATRAAAWRDFQRALFGASPVHDAAPLPGASAAQRIVGRSTIDAA